MLYTGYIRMIGFIRSTTYLDRIWKHYLKLKHYNRTNLNLLFSSNKLYNHASILLKEKYPFENALTSLIKLPIFLFVFFSYINEISLNEFKLPILFLVFLVTLMKYP